MYLEEWNAFSNHNSLSLLKVQMKFKNSLVKERVKAVYLTNISRKVKL